ncbi:hypothetical protein [Pseudonocardia acaciae]|uniref:hypothetical protein n=1 Tax=Pseudonocardia acaciae TaxID=551276 RepID=UPI000684EDF5|nr:hypothetical protein [Pseudonocardia acaciae]
MADRPRTRLEQKIRAAHLSQRDVLRRFPSEARRLGENEIAVSERQLKRWLRGGAPIPRTAAFCRVLEGWFGEPVERLLGPPDELAAPAEGGDAVAEAGRRSVEHAISSAGAIDPSALEHLQDAARRAANGCLSRPPLTMLTELVQLRDTAYEQLDRTSKPRQQAELYLLAGLCCGLLTSVSFDLGHPDVAEEQARAAFTYGSVIDHPSLCAWARGLQATVALWSGLPRRAVAAAEAGLIGAPAGTSRVRLHSVRARALSLIGARDEVSADLAAASDQLELAGDDEFQDSVGGELLFDRSRHALCASSAYVALNDGKRAEPAAEHAVQAFAELPAGRRWASGQVSATVDLGTARVLRGDLAGCEAAIRAVFGLPSAERTEGVAQRLLTLGRLVGAPRFRGAIEAAQLGENIEEFTAGSLGRTTARPAIGPS